MFKPGLDPASPLFRQMLSASLTSLSADDAAFVDVVHTDGARIWSEGFGLFNPIGDVDYFPNGGLDQPGCEQVRGPVIVSRFGKLYFGRCTSSHDCAVITLISVYNITVYIY